MIAYITENDMRRWEKEQRLDIISHVRGTEIQWFGDIILTGNGIHIQSCTFLNYDGNVFFCDIYETRPRFAAIICRVPQPCVLFIRAMDKKYFTDNSSPL